MPKVTSKLTELSYDQRSNEVAFELMIENQTPTPINLIRLVPRIPDGVKQSQIKDASQLDIDTRYKALCNELSSLVNTQLTIVDNEYREQLKKILREILSNIAGSSIFALSYKILAGTSLKDEMARATLKSEAFEFKIEGVDDASAAKKLIESSDGTSTTLGNVYEAKFNKLVQLEALKMRGEIGVAAVEPEIPFKTTYVFRFPRGVINPRRFNLTIDAVYSEQNSDKQHLSSASYTLTISPRPLSLSFIAICSSILGVLLQLAMSKDGGLICSGILSGSFETVAQSSPKFIAGIILSLVFYNIYEFTEIGKKLTIGIGWRSALLLGFLCGIGGDRILAALKALLGIT